MKRTITWLSIIYRPIIWLSTMYKILTSILTERNYNFLDVNNILPSEHKGCKQDPMAAKTSC